MKIKKTEGGQGGKKGHSNMVHWDYTEQVKASSNKSRRHADKNVIKKALEEK